MLSCEKKGIEMSGIEGVSVSKLTTDTHCTVHFLQKLFVMEDHLQTFRIDKLHGHLYKLILPTTRLKTTSPTSTAICNSTLASVKATSEIWYKRLGHPSLQVVKVLKA